MIATTTYVLVGADGQPYNSPQPGVWGGYDGTDGLRLYGRLDCPSALSHIRRGGYVQRRVFFASEEDAIAAGFRPCGRCLRDKYEAWKEEQK